MYIYICTYKYIYIYVCVVRIQIYLISEHAPLLSLSLSLGVAVYPTACYPTAFLVFWEFTLGYRWDHRQYRIDADNLADHIAVVVDVSGCKPAYGPQLYMSSPPSEIPMKHQSMAGSKPQSPVGTAQNHTQPHWSSTCWIAIVFIPITVFPMISVKTCYRSQVLIAI